MKHYLVSVYQVWSNYGIGAKSGSVLGWQYLHWLVIGETWNTSSSSCLNPQGQGPWYVSVHLRPSICLELLSIGHWSNLIHFGLNVNNLLGLPLHSLTLHIHAVGNVSGYRCVSDCISRGREFDPSPVPYFRGDWSWNDFYGHSPPFRWFIEEGLLSVTSESMCTNYWLTACSSLPRKKCG